MEEKIQVRASLGTKLPKFGGSKPLGNFLQRTTNGGHTSLIGKSNLTRGENKHSDLDRTSSSSSSSSFSLNWRKLKKNDQADKEPSDTTIEKVQDKRFFQPQLAGDKDGSRLQIIGKSGKQSNMLLPQKPNLNENLLSGMSNSTKLTKSTQFGRTSYSGFNGCKTQINGFYTNKPPTGLQRPRANSATTRNFSNKILPQSADNMKTFSNVRRSQSFSHSIQNPLLPSTPLTRSHSFNKEVDLSKPYETQNVPIRTILKPTLLSRTAKQYELSNGNEPNMKSSFTRTYSAGSGSSLKKPGLSNGAQQTGPLGYRMTRPSLLKPTRTQVPRETAIDGTKDPSYFSSVTEKTEHGKSETDKSDKGQEIDLDIIGSYPICNNLDAKDCKDKYCSDDIDDLSISSLSSSDKNDLTEDFSDEFIDLDEENKSLLVESVKKVVEKPYVEYSLGSLQDNTKSLLSKPDDWIGVNITVKSEEESASSPYGDNRISPDMEYRDPSSLELSPSDSSDGTYMWDEEGMEPIGNVHPCGSYESSEMNSLDILNNLDSCDLEDDDLMLDVDLPEDTPCDIGKGENMSHFERTERNLRQQQGFWKRAPPRLNGQEQYHLSNPDNYQNGSVSIYLESPTDHRESCGSPGFYSPSPRTTQIMGLRENIVMLDEMTLRHMVQDCTAVKTQLFKLKRLLQQEDDSGSLTDIQLSVPTTPEPQEPEPLWKTEDLLNEIRQLKEESKKKDEKIKEMEHQLKMRCKCQSESHESKREKPKQCDKYTQIPWRRSSHQVLQCSSNSPSSTDHNLAKLITQPLIDGPSKLEELIHSPLLCNKNEDVGDCTNVPENELSVLLSTQLKINDVEDNLKGVQQSEEHVLSQGQHVTNKDSDEKQLSSELSAHIPVEAKKSTQSKLMDRVSSSSSTGQVPRPKTLQLYKPKTQTTVAHQGMANSLLALNSLPTCKDSKIRPITSSLSLAQSQIDSKSSAQKFQEPIQNDSSVYQPAAHVPSDRVSAILLPSSATVNLAQSLQSKTDLRKSPPFSSAPTGNCKLPSAGSFPSPLKVPAVELSQQSCKQIPKASMLRAPSNFASKLKKPTSPKPDILHSPAVSNESPKSSLKTTSSINSRPLSNKKDHIQESVESSVPKRQSRLPQPKTH